MELKGKTSKMAGLFLYASILQGGIAAVITFLGGFGDQLGLFPVGVSRVIVSGELGTWFLLGYVMYIVVGVVAMAVTSLFYFYIETVLGKGYSGGAKTLAWMHLVLGNVGVAGAAILTMVGGYLGGAGMQLQSIQLESRIQYYSQPIAAFLILALLGFILGGLGYLLAMRPK